MIQLNFDLISNMTHINLLDNTKVSFYCREWKKSKPPIENTIFDIFNDYLKTLPIETLQQLVIFFNKSFELFNDEFVIKSDDIKQINDELFILIKSYFEILSFEDFKFKFQNDERFKFDLCEKKVVGKLDTESLTYLEKDYSELVLFTQFLKGLFPVIGGYFNLLGNIIGDNIYVIISNILSTTECVNFEVYKKLFRYVRTVQNIRVDSDGYSLMGGITPDDLSDFLFGLLFVKRIVQYEYTTNKSIISFLWFLLNNTCIKIRNTKPKEVSATKDDGTERGIDDRWSISQKQPIADRIIVEFYLSKIEQVLVNIDNTIDVNLITNVFESIDFNTFEINNYHLPLCGLILQDVLDIPNLEIINREGFLRAILISSIVMNHLGFTKLSTLMLAQPMKINPLVLIIGAKLFKNLRSDIQQRFDKLYPYLPEGENPGVAGLNKILTDINQFDWSNILDVSDIGFDILSLIENRNTEKVDVLTLIK